MTTLNRHGTHAANRLEREVAAWLAEVEPASTPIALRLRTYGEVRDEATRPRPRLAWLRPALSLAGSVLAIGGTAFAVMALVVVANAIDRSGSGPAGQPGTGEPGSTGSYLLISLLVAAAGVVAGASLYLRFIRRSFVRLTFGATRATPADLVPVRRPWGAVGWATVGLAVLTLLTAILAALECLDYARTGWVTDQVVDLLLLELGMAPLVLVIVWRYPLRNRATRLLLAGAVLSLVYLWAGFGLYWIDDLWSLADPQFWELSVDYLLPMAALVVLVTGLAARLNVRVGPPIALAAVFVALGFMETRFGPMLPDETPPLLTQLKWVVEGLNQWFILLAWLAAAWIGFAGFRRTRSRAWLIVLAAGAIGASGYGGVYVTTAGLVVDFGPYTETWLRLMDLANTWYHLAMALAQVGLLVALAVGLPPAVATPSEPKEPASDAASERAEPAPAND